ncbi:winged helix-turn-helix domain-containing protein [Streptomyces sp. 8ZJF_21]|uniref:winged helix-turn-helix domain-containing protein n=1 Tax=Streptomyces sp. 8ZJF_21 TaxID=2903141 RepID=UPI001E2E7A3E|nr:winged helix-turn-helix domain-containing protein [Streptomyces sp. 8ZJF_21]MCD9589536.1 winged helix-turn-helix domain-containing protein [Streptomyces sp. 8ZJF_21]
MRVLIVDDMRDDDVGDDVDDPVGDPVGGVVRRGESAAERLAGELRRAGHTVEVVAGDGSAPGPPRRSVLECAGLVLDVPGRRVSRDGWPVALTGREFDVLEVLMRADGAVVSGEELLARVWGGELGARSNAVRIAVSRLRAKLGRPAVVETVPRSGYRLRHADRSAEDRSAEDRSSEGRSLAAPRSAAGRFLAARSSGDRSAAARSLDARSSGARSS